MTDAPKNPPEWRERLLRLRDADSDNSALLQESPEFRAEFAELCAFEEKLRGPDDVVQLSPRLEERLKAAFERAASDQQSVDLPRQIAPAAWISGLAAVFLFAVALLWVRDVGLYEASPIGVGYTVPHRGVVQTVRSGEPFHLLVRSPETASAAVYIVSVDAEGAELFFPAAGVGDDRDFLGHAGVEQPAGSQRLFPDPTYGALVSQETSERYLVVATPTPLSPAQERRLKQAIAELPASRARAYLERYFGTVSEITVTIQ